MASEDRDSRIVKLRAMSEEGKTLIADLQAKNNELAVKIEKAKLLKEKGYSDRAIVKALNMPESSVRALFATKNTD